MKLSHSLAAVACMLSAGLAFSADRTWTGAGGNADWSTPGNWVGSVVPTAGDRAIFPAGPSNKSVVLSAPVSIDAIDFRDCGYTVSSGSAPLTLESATPVSSDCSASPGNELNPSLLTLNASLPQVTVRATGGPPVGRDLLRLGVGSNTVQVGQGPLRFDIQQLTTGIIPEVRSNFSVTSGGVEINGNGVVIPGAATSFAGVMRCLGGVLRVTNASALGANGSLAARTEVHSGCALELAAAVANETLQLRHNVLATPPVVRGVTNVSWSGPIEILGTVAVADRQAQFAFASPVTLSLSGTFSGDGALAVAGPELGSLRLQTAATHTGDTLIEAPAALVIEDLSDVLPDTTVLRLNGGKFEYRTIALSGTDTIAGIEGSIGSEILLEGYKGLRLNDTANRTYAGKISGIGFVEKLGGGILTLPGMIGVSNLTINNGAVALNNPSNVGSVQVQASGALHTGIVGGTGALSSGTSTTAAIRPGGPTAGGTLQVNGPLNVAGGVTLEFDFPGGSRGGSADRIVLPNPTDTVALGGASLAVVFDTALNPGSSAMVIENAGVDAITGTFAGVPDDSIQNFSGDNYRVDYQGGDGNDFTISRPELLSFVNPASLPDGVVGIAYGQSLRALGGFPGYTFNVTSGALPSGLSLLPSGVFSGAPIGSGLFTFDVQATDLAGDTVTRNFTLRVLTGSAVWDGGGADDFWATAQNWQGDVAPTPGQTLIFPAGAPRPTSINNFPAGTVFAGIKMAHGQSITGNAISLSSNLPIEVRPTASNFSSIGVDLTFQASNATVQAFANYAGPSGQFALTAGGSTVSFSGTLVLSVGNQNVGTEYFIAASNLIGGNVEMNSGGLPDPGRVDLVGDSTFTGSALIDGGVEVLLRTSQGLGTGDNSSATGTQIRNGNLILAPPSTPFTVANERAFINDDGAGVPAKLAFQGGAVFDAIWSGSVVTGGTGTARIEVFSGQMFRISGDISGNSPVFLGGTSGTTIEFTNSGNSFTGDLVLGPDTTLAVGSMSLPTNTDLSMANTATFRMPGTSQTLTSLNGGGVVNMSPGGELTLDIAGSSSYTGQFQMTGGTLRKIGSGSFQYSGFVASGGTCILGSGDLRVEGTMGCQLRIDNGRLSGTGSVGSIINDSSTSSGSIELGENIFSAAADVDLGSAIQYLPLLGSPGSRILLNGTLNLSGAVLAPVTTAPISPSQSFVIIENAAGNTVTGTFAGAPEGSIVESAPLPQTFRVSYAGGNGNDVTLTRVVVPRITTLGAPPATVGVPYNAFIQTVDGTPPYSYSVVSGSLPPGIALSDDGTFGILSGTASGNGTFNFVVEVTDNNSETDTQLFEFVVNGGGGSVFTWDGGSSTDSNWTTATNWVGDVAPLGTGTEELIFPEGSARRTNSNDFPDDTEFESIEVASTGYVMNGNRVVLNGNFPIITVAPSKVGADSTIDFDITLNNPAELLAETTGSGPRNRLRLHTISPTNGLGVAFDLDLVSENLSGTAYAGMVLGRLRQKGSVDVYVDGHFELRESDLTGKIEVLGGALTLSSPAALGNSLGTLATGIEVSSDAELVLLEGFVSPLNELLVLSASAGNPPGVQGPGSWQWRGPIQVLGGAEVGFGTLGTGSTARLSGAITGTSDITLFGFAAGTIALENSANAWAGSLASVGSVVVTAAGNSIPDSADVLIGAGTTLQLAGSETVANILVDGVLEPTTYRLTANDIEFSSTATFQAFWSGNNPGVNQSQLAAFGTVLIDTAATLTASGSTLTSGQSVRLIDNDFSDPISGHFNAAVEDDEITLAGSNYRVRYGAFDGNDMQLFRYDVLNITTTALADAQVGVPYADSVAADGGYNAINWSASGLPPGLSMDSAGLVTGTPTIDGSSSANVTAIDSLPVPSNVDNQMVSITVLPAGGSTFVWDGGSSTDANWTTAANWVDDIAPVGNMGEALQFPDSAARKTNVNDFPADTLFDSLTVSARDYVITGNDLELDGLQPLVTVAPTTLGADSRIDLNLGFPGSSDFLAITTGNGTRNKLLLNTQSATDVDLGADAVFEMTNGTGSALTGMHFGRIRQKGPINITVQSGFYRIDDSNHTGSITVQGGNLELGSAAAVGSSNGLAATGIEVTSSGQLILASGFVSPALERLSLVSGLLAADGAVEWAGSIVINGSADFVVFGSTALLRLQGAITGTGNIGVNGDPFGIVRFQNPSNAWVGDLSCTVTCELGADEVIPNTAVVSVGLASRSSLGGFATLRLSSAVETVAQLNVIEVLEPGFAVINTGGFNMNSGSRLRARWTGNTPGVNQSQIVVAGTVNLAATAMLDPIDATLSTGSLVKLIDNDMSDPISGIFQGMAENAAVALLGSNYRVRYTAIDGNDLVFFRLDPLDITTNSLPDGQVLVPYDQTVVATGGFLTGSWSATGLPPGLSIASGTGRITGNPSMAGTFNPSITVTDSLPAPASTDTQVIAITINASGGGTSVWDGGGADDLWSTAQNWAGDVAPTPGIGDRLVFPQGAARKSNTNDFPNGSIFDSIEISTSDYVIAGNSVRLSGNPGLVANAPLTVGADSTLDLEITLDDNQLLAITVGDGPRNTLRVNSISSTNRVIVNSNMTLESLNQSAGTGLTGMRIDRLEFAGGSEIAINGVYSIGASNHTGKIQVLGGAFIALSPAAFGSGDGTIATGVEVNTDGQLALSGAGVIAPASERLYLHDTRPGQPPSLVAFGAGQWNGPIELAGASHRFAALSSQLLRISGAITGTSSTMAFEGSPSNGEIRLENSANAFSGNILSTGDLTLSTQIAEVIPNTASLDVGTGVVLRLGGNETLSAIDIAGTLAPHEFILTATDIDFIAGSTLRPNWNGAIPGSNQAQLVASNSVDLSANPILDAPLASLSDGTTIRLIDNQSANPTLGHFTGVTENQDAILNGGRYRLRYGAGTGNDVELIRYELLAISAPATLPNGTLGVSYTQAITATGGIAPYSWSATGLPAGLSIDPGTGVISGSPSASGPFSVTVDVIDNFPSPSNNQQRVYGLTISNSEPTTASVVSVAPANFVLFPASFTPTARVVGTATRPSGTLQLRADEAFSKATITCNASTINGPGPLDLDGSCALTPTTPGIWQVSASFTGGPGYLNSFTPSVDYTVRATSSFGAITQSATTTVVGEPFTVTINLSGNGIAPFGMVNVQPLPVGNFASCNLAPTGGNNSACSVTIISPAAVAKLLNVSYLGSGGPVPVFAPFNAPTQGHNTEKAQSISAITSSGPNPALQNQPITVNYRVAIQAPGAPTALSPIDGEVRVSDGTTQCTGTLTQNGAFATGSCQLSIATLGARSLTATYLGNQAFLPSVSPVFTQNVVAAGTGPDLAVALGNGSNSLIGGNTVKYVLRVRNFGPVAATNASVTMPVPSGASNMSWTCTPIPPSSCNGTGSGAISQLVSLAQPGAEPSEVRFDITLTLPSNEGAFTASAQVAAPSGQSDPNLSNNAVVDTDFIGLFADGFEDVNPNE